MNTIPAHALEVALRMTGCGPARCCHIVEGSIRAQVLSAATDAEGGQIISAWYGGGYLGSGVFIEAHSEFLLVGWGHAPGWDAKTKVRVPWVEVARWVRHGLPAEQLSLFGEAS